MCGHRILGALLLGLMVLSAGCSFAPVELYQLQHQAQGVTQQSDDAAVLIGPVRLADYLQREHILQRQSDGRLLFSREARWAGDLQEEVGLLLLRQIAQQTGNSHIALYPDRVGVKQQAQIVLSISRLDSGPQQPAVLEAQWRLLDAKGRARDSGVVRYEQQHNGELADQVNVQSELLQRLANELAEKVQQFLPARNVAATKAKPTKNKPRSIPILPGVVSEPETYRF